MDLVYPVCAGIDVHRDTLVVTVSRSVGRRQESETQTFGTVTEELRALVAWLDGQHVPIAALAAPFATPVERYSLHTRRSSGRVRSRIATSWAKHVTNGAGSMSSSKLGFPVWSSDTSVETRSMRTA